MSQAVATTAPSRRVSLPGLARAAVAALIGLAAACFSCAVMVPAGEAVVITSFGAPVRVLTSPGLAWKWPAPIEASIPVDLRLHTSSGGLADVGTREGLRILVQAYVVWNLPDEPGRIEQYLRAGGNDPDEVARQLRSLLGSALQVTASEFALSDLVNTDPARVRLAAFEQALAATVAHQAMDMYGVQVSQVGVERLSLPAETLAATVARMRAERETVAAERNAEGLRQAAAIRSDATRDARMLAARTHAEAAAIEADAQRKAASLYGASYARDPQLYATLRSLDTIASIVGPHTRLVLRTDSAPFSGPAQADRTLTGMHIASHPPAPDGPSPGREGPPRPPTPADGGALAQSVALTFRVLGLVTALMALVWACSNIRQVASDRTAVVERFGRVSHVQRSGLLLAWPAPFEQVRMLPAPSRQIPLAVAAEATAGYVTDETDLELEPSDDVIHMESDRDAANASYLLTGEGNVVRLEATLFYRITDPSAYILSESHLVSALRRLFLASAVTLAASHRLDDFLVAEPAAPGPAGSGDPLLVARREALRGDLVRAVNRRVQAIARTSGDLGIEVMRTDLVALLPPRAKAAFDEVLTASQISEQNIAAARTDAAHVSQEADRDHDRLLDEAEAAADERIRNAASEVAPVAALQSSLAADHAGPEMRATLLLRAWRDGVATILRRAGNVTVVDARSAGQAILPAPDEPQGATR